MFRFALFYFVFFSEQSHSELMALLAELICRVNLQLKQVSGSMVTSHIEVWTMCRAKDRYKTYKLGFCFLRFIFN